MRRGRLSDTGDRPAAATGMVWLVALAALIALGADPRPACASPGLTDARTGAGTLAFGGRVAPRIETRIETRIRGVIARTRVVQRFRNPHDTWLDAVYAFPLPEGAAVDGMSVVSGERRIEGRIQERGAARARFERARDAGRRAALLEQERTNWFRTAVSAIEPHGEVEVTIEYQEVLTPESDGVRWRLPLAAPAHTGEAVEAPLVEVATQRERGAAARARTPASAPVQIRIDLEPGFPLASIESATHALTRQSLAGDRLRLEASTSGDRDLELAWRWQPSTDPTWRILAEETADGKTAVLLMGLPPEASRTAALRAPREWVLAIDTSGSMAGAPMRHARQAIASALDRMADEDRFDLVAFDETATPLFGEPRIASPENRARARRFVDDLEAGGGTDIAAALEAALPDEAPRSDSQRVRQVVFVSDGAAPDEARLLARLSARLGRARFHAVAIGSAPNGAFLRAAARIGRGSVTFISARSEVGLRMEQLFQKLESPVTTDLEVDWPDRVEMWPPRPPDLHAGEPLVVTALVPRFVGDVVVRGRLAGRPVEWRLPLRPDAEPAGIGRLFARRKIQALTDSLAGGADRAVVDRAVLKTALEHQIVSSRTSLVAVETTPRRPASAPNRAGLAHAPAFTGSDPMAAMGSALPAGSTPGPLLVRCGLALWLAAVAAAAGRRRWVRPR